MLKRLVLLFTVILSSLNLFAQKEETTTNNSVVNLGFYAVRKYESGIAERGTKRPLPVQAAKQLLGNDYSQYMTYIKKWKRGQRTMIAGSAIAGTGLLVLVASIPYFYFVGVDNGAFYTSMGFFAVGLPIGIAGVATLNVNKNKANDILTECSWRNENQTSNYNKPLELRYGFTNKGVSLNLSF